MIGAASASARYNRRFDDQTPVPTMDYTGPTAATTHDRDAAAETWSLAGDVRKLIVLGDAAGAGPPAGIFP